MDKLQLEMQMAAQGMSLTTGLATSAILSRYLGVEGFGQFYYVFAFYYFFLTLNDLGVNTIILREISQKPEQSATMLGTMLIFKLCLAAVSVLAAWTAISWMDFPPVLKNALTIYAFVLVATSLQLPSVIFQAVLKLEYSSGILIFSPSCWA